MEIINILKELYEDGLRWSVFEPDEGSFAQIYYIGLVITEIAVLWNIHYPNNLIYTCMILMHVLSMYILGYKKKMWEASILEGSHRERIYQIVYFTLNIIFCGLTIITTKSFVALVFILIPTLGTFLLLALWQLIFGLMLMVVVGTNFFSRNEEPLYLTIFYSLIIIPVVMAVLLLPIFVVWKAVILLAFCFSIPLIVVGAINGMYFLDFFSVFK